MWARWGLPDPTWGGGQGTGWGTGWPVAAPAPPGLMGACAQAGSRLGLCPWSGAQAVLLTAPRPW